MAKKKELNTFLRFLKMSARVLILNIPAVIILLICLALGKISWLTALICLLGFWAISAIIVRGVFKDLDNFVSYLKQLGQGFEPELPKLKWGFFSSMRLTKTFLSLKNIWSNQFLSDSRILENLSNPLLMTDPDSKIVFANTAAQNFFGEKILGKDIEQLFKDDHVVGAYYSVLHKKAPRQSVDWDGQGKDKKHYSFQIKIEPLPAPTRSGAITFFAMFDVTPFQVFKQQQADFFANASHELKTPLAIISGFIETLQGPAKNDPEAQEKFLKMMADQTTRMTDLVQKMLQLSRLQAPQSKTENEAVMIPDLLQSVVDDFQVRAKSAHKKLSLSLEDSLPRVMGNRRDLYHVFQNLIDNAIKYGEKNSTISITAKLSDSVPQKFYQKEAGVGQFVSVAVGNKGPVIAPDDIERLFDKFYRVESDKANPVEGTGLGLGIAQQIVQRHDGFIDASSTETSGTVFTVYLPVNI